MPRRGEDDGVCLPFPVRSRWSYKNDNPDTTVGSFSKREFESEIYLGNPRMRLDVFDDFAGAPNFDIQLEGLAVLSSSVAADVGKSLVTVTTAQVTGEDITIQNAGTISAIEFVGGVTLAANDTNYVTFTVTNKGAAGSGTTVVLAATAANTTQLTGGSSWTANVPFQATLSATPANTRVSPLDVLAVAITVTGTLANQVPDPVVRIVMRKASGGTTQGRTTKTAGGPSVTIQLNQKNGEAALLLDSTSEVQFAGLDWIDQLMIPGLSRWHFSTFFKLNTTLSTSESAIWGLQTAYNSTLASVTKFARFRLNASMVLTYEAKDGTTTVTAGALNRGGITLVAGTYYLLTIDQMKSGLVRWFVNDTLFATAPMAALANTDLFQPEVGVHKSTGAAVTSMNVDYVRTAWNRV